MLTHYLLLVPFMTAKIENKIVLLLVYHNNNNNIPPLKEPFSILYIIITIVPYIHIYKS